MSDSPEPPLPDDDQPWLFDFSKPPVPPRSRWREILNFITVWRLQFGIGLAIALIGWVWLRPSAHAQNNTPSRAENPKEEVAKPPAVVPPSPVPVPATPAPAASPVQAVVKPAGPKISWSSVNVDGPYIAITFDDGPHISNTPKLLAMLKQRNIKATFFLVGECAKQYPEIVKREVAEGHEIANHSWSHPNLAKMSDEAVRGQLQRTGDAIVAACGVKPKIMRPPYGELSSRQRAWVNADLGYKIILWDVDPLDWKFRNSEHVSHEILTHTHNGSIILVHDIHATSVDAMPATLDALLARGFKFVTVSELLAMETAKVQVAQPASAPAATPSVAGAGTTPKPSQKTNGKRKRAN